MTIGRRSQLAEIGYLLDRVAAGTDGLLVILGAPGSGRTARRLASGTWRLVVVDDVDPAGPRAVEMLASWPVSGG